MSEWTLSPRVKYEKDVSANFFQEIISIPGGEKLNQCIQCGTCSSICPLSGYMDYTPRRIIAMTREGFKDEVLKSYTIWLCASCYACQVECPKEIGITELMYALKRTAIEENVYPKKFPIPALAGIFFEMLKKYGRITESRVISKLYLHTPFKSLKKTRLGGRMFKKGRLGIKREQIDNKDQLQKLLKAVESDPDKREEVA